MRLLVNALLIGIIIGALIANFGCSASFTADVFYWEKAEPRTQMPWYGSVTGMSNRHAKGFATLQD